MRDIELERELAQAASDIAATTGTSFDEAYRAIVDRVNLEAENERLRNALHAARDFIAFHPAVSGKWPLLTDLIDEALARG